MRKIIPLSMATLMIVIWLGVAFGGEQDDISKHPVCPYCGMDRAKFAHSRMLFEYNKGKALGFCSIRCAAVDMAFVLDKTPKAIRVGDYKTKKLIDAEKAHWVIGGDKPGVMTRRAKWAFEKKSDADAFIKAHGGESATFEKAMEAAYADMYRDNKMIREKRKKMRMKKK